MKTKEEKDVLFMSVYKMIISICSKYNHGKTAHSQDLVQEASIVAYNALDSYDETKSKLTTYIYYVVLNVIRNKQTRKNFERNQRFEFLKNKKRVRMIQDVEEKTNEDLNIKPCLAYYQEFLDTLSEEDKNIFDEYFKVRSIQKLSDKTGLSVSFLRKKIKNLKNQIHSRIEESNEV